MKTSKKVKFRDWIIEQKYTLQRGYTWSNIPAMGIVVASSIQNVLGGVFDKFWKFIMLVLFGLFILWLIGVIDKRYHFLHTENNYSVKVNPYMMELINAGRKNKLKK